MSIKLKQLGLALAGAAMLTLAACGGDGDSPATPGGASGMASLSGVVADGLISGAIVCYDLNDNNRCDSGEPVSSGTGADGGYLLSVPEAEAGKHAVIAMVPATAIDQDNPGVPVGVPFTLKSPAQADTSLPVFVSPITTIVADIMDATGATDPAAAIEQVRAQLGMTGSPLTNYVATRDSDPDAARTGSIAQVLTEIQKEIARTADAAGVESGKKQALVSVIILNNLSTIASNVAANTGTAADLGQSLVQTQGVSADTVVAQAEIASKLTASAPDTATSTPVPFVNVRDLRYTNSNNWSYRLFTGDDVADGNGFKYANEIRRTKSGGSMRAFQRDASYYDDVAAKWYECPSDGYRAVKNSVDAAGNPVSLFCHTFASTMRRTDESIAGLTMRSVIERIRGSGIGDYATWGPEPTVVSADAVFPAGATLRYQLDNQTANPDAHSLSNKVRILPAGAGPTTPVAYNTWPFAATLEQFITSNYGTYSGSIISGNNTDQIGVVPDNTVTDPGLQKKAYYRVAFQSTSGTGGNARYYKCRRDTSGGQEGGVTTACEVLSNGTYTIETKADSRVLRLAGIPADAVAITGSSRIYVERAGAVFYGQKNLLQTTTSIRLNKAAWDALLPQLPGVVAHVEPAAPPAPDAASWLRDIRDLGDNGFTYRIIDSIGSASGTLKETRVTYDGSDPGVLQPFARNRTYWNGSAWQDSETLCPSSGLNFGTWTSSPRESTVCGLIRESQTGFDAEIGGKTMSFVINEARGYGSRDGTQDFRNWGPTVLSTDDEYAAFTTTPFPAGSKLRYQVSTTLQTADAIATDAQSQVTAGSPTVAVTSLGSVTTIFTGGFSGGANGGNTLGIFSYQGAGVPAGGTTGLKRVRVSFQATSGTGGNVKYFLCDQNSATFGTTACVETATSTYTITAQGGKNVLRFATMPSQITTFGSFIRFLAEHNGGVYLGNAGIVGSKTYSLRLNQTAYEALLGLFGETEYQNGTTVAD